MKWIRQEYAATAVIVSDLIANSACTHFVSVFVNALQLVTKVAYVCLFCFFIGLLSAIRTDLSLLLECLKFQMKSPDLQKQALLTIHSICEKRGNYPQTPPAYTNNVTQPY